MANRSELLYPDEDRGFLQRFLPQHEVSPSDEQAMPLPWVTLTFATSLDSALSIAPGVQTALSGPQSKAMTHYLRSRHDAILVGVGTAIADNPSLNCRLSGVGGYGGEALVGQPRPIVIDPHGRWQLGPETKILSLAKQGRGRAPWVVTSSKPDSEKVRLLEDVGGKFIVLPEKPQFEWRDILQAIRAEGIKSIMIEGGGAVINRLLSSANVELINSIIVTIAPIWLGQGGVVVSPPRSSTQGSLPVARLKDTVWRQLGEDCVLCGSLA